MSENKTFMCANKSCAYHTRQPIEKSALEINGYRLCQDCFDKGKRMRVDVVVFNVDLPERVNQNLKRLRELL